MSILYVYILYKIVLHLSYISLPKFDSYCFIMKTNSGMIEKQIEMIFVILSGEYVKIPVKQSKC